MRSRTDPDDGAAGGFSAADLLRQLTLTRAREADFRRQVTDLERQLHDARCRIRELERRPATTVILTDR